MKKLMLFALIALFAGSSQAFAEGTKYGFVDVAKIFDEYQRTKDQDKVLQEAGRERESEREALVSDIRQLKDEMALLSDEAREKKSDILERKIEKLQDFDRDARRDLGKERNAVVREIFDDIDATVQRYGKKQGFEMIFNERALLYHGDKYDITRDVLNELNKAYLKQKK